MSNENISTGRTTKRRTTVKAEKQKLANTLGVQSEYSAQSPDEDQTEAKKLYKDIKEAIHGDIKEELCKWQLPSEIKKTDCIPIKCPPDRTKSEG